METSDVHLLRPAEVVALLGVSRSWLYDAAKSGRIPCVRLGGPDGPVRFRLRELEVWIEQGRVAESQPPPSASEPSRELRGRKPWLADPGQHRFVSEPPP
jgi:excisionase family DNA binding protein